MTKDALETVKPLTIQLGNTADVEGYEDGKLQVAELGDVKLPFAVFDREQQLERFTDLLPRPINVEQTTSLKTAKDFIAYVNRFADNDSLVFVDVLNGRVKAVLDFHEATKNEKDNSNTVPRYCGHVAKLEVGFTTEFQKIKDASGKRMTQQDFALFIEDVMPFISQPVAAEMYEIVNTLQSKTNVDFKSGIRTQNGEVQITYNESIEASAGRSGNLSIPEMIVFGVQIHRGGEHYALPARFRYRIKDGNLVMWYDIDQLEKAIETSMQDTVDYIKNGKTIPEPKAPEDVDAVIDLPGVTCLVLEGTV